MGMRRTEVCTYQVASVPDDAAGSGRLWPCARRQGAPSSEIEPIVGQDDSNWGKMHPTKRGGPTWLLGGGARDDPAGRN